MERIKKQEVRRIRYGCCQSRRQSSPHRRDKRLSAGGAPKFKIKCESRCFQKSKLVDWGPGCYITAEVALISLRIFDKQSFKETVAINA